MSPLEIRTFLGEGEGLYAIHGFGGDAQDIAPFAEYFLKPIHSVRLPEDRGGDSWDPSSYTPSALLSALKETLPFKSIVLGYSMGARLLLQFACHYPDHLKKIILVSGSPGISNSDQRRTRQLSDKKIINRINDMGVAEFFEWWSKHPMIKSQSQISDVYRKGMRVRRESRSPRELQSSLRGFGQGAMLPCWDKLKTLALPVCLLTGENDKKYSEIAKEMATHIRSSKHFIVSKSGHCPHLEQPKSSAECILSWLETADHSNGLGRIKL
jgi:2-succinyl-6-hydroxy-2,4-cyclohexadiene-1-carboxylate synthase